MANDPKWRTIANKSGQKIGDVMAVYIHHLISASMSNPRGVTQCNAEDVSTALDLNIEQVEAINAAMQGRVLDGNRLTGWDERQPKREDNSNGRVKEYRERNAVKRSVTQSNSREDKDTDKKESTKESFSESFFETFWEKFPRQRRGDKQKTFTAWKTAITKSPPEEILHGLEAYRGSSEVSDGYAKGAAAWLTDSRWLNDYGARPAVSAKPQPRYTEAKSGVRTL
jgi:hypothetical protein